VNTAVISSVRIAAAHDGVAELVVTLRHGNGGESAVMLDEVAAAALFSACQADNANDLIGHSWEKVRQALNISWNRFNRNDSGESKPCTT
jgi:hypothetical protein